MPLSFRQAQGAFIAGPNITLYPSGNSIAISSTTIPTPSEGILFNTTANLTSGNTTAEFSIISSSIRGSAILSASTATTLPQQTAGRRYRFTANGTIQTHSTAGNLTSRIKLGSVLIASAVTSLHNSIPANTTIFIDSTFTIRTAGSGGTVASRGIIHSTHTNLIANGSNSAPITPATTSIDTRTAKLFDFTFQFGTLNASNTITINEATLEYLDI